MVHKKQQLLEESKTFESDQNEEHEMLWSGIMAEEKKTDSQKINKLITKLNSELSGIKIKIKANLLQASELQNSHPLQNLPEIGENPPNGD